MDKHRQLIEINLNRVAILILSPVAHFFQRGHNVLLSYGDLSVLFIKVYILIKYKFLISN